MNEPAQLGLPLGPGRCKRCGMPTKAKRAVFCSVECYRLSRVRPRRRRVADLDPLLADIHAPKHAGKGDMDRGLAMASLLCPDSPRVHVTIIGGIPPSKARSRVGTKGRFYNPSKSLEEKTAAVMLPSFPEPWEGNVAVMCMFFRPDSRRVDTDNMLKHILDAANGICWHDDCQVTAVMGITELDRELPRTIFVIGEHDSSIQRGPIEPRACQQCKAFFRPKYLKQRFCSMVCQTDARRKVKRKCVGCGGPVSHSGIRRCRACWEKAGKPEWDVEEP